LIVQSESSTHRRSFGSIRVRTPLVLPGQRIGIMGGSFNPPHAGHVTVAETALRRLNLDCVWWVVTPGNPLKTHGGLAPLAERMAQCRTLAKGPRFEVTSFEQELDSPYTAVTLKFLVRRFPSTQFVWVMGADNLVNFDRWQSWRAIAGLLPIAVVDRPGWRLPALSGPAGQELARYRLPEAKAALLAGRKPPAWCFLTTRLSPLSSTALRSHKNK
jgi:nicotinate-nucleotide adenylyltransferase